MCSSQLKYYCFLYPAKKESAIEKQLKEEEKILESIAEKKALMGVAELARGIQYEDPIKTRYFAYNICYMTECFNNLFLQVGHPQDVYWTCQEIILISWGESYASLLKGRMYHFPFPHLMPWSFQEEF